MALRLSGDGRITGVDTALTGLITDAGGGIIQPDDPSVIPLTLAGASGQTANLFEVKDYDENFVGTIDKDGNLTIFSNISASGNLSVAGEFVDDVVLPLSTTVDGEKIMPTGSESDKIFYENGQTITESYSIPVGKNALSCGPVIVGEGVTVIVPSGSDWSVV